MKTVKKERPSINGFSNRLRQLRRQKNLSQAELSTLAHIHVTHISRYERGLSLPSADTLTRLAAIFEVTGDYLLEGASSESARTTFENRDLLMLFKEIERMAPDEQFVIRTLIEAFVAKKKIRELVIA